MHRAEAFMTHSLADAVEAVRAQHGPWTAHNVRLAESVYTIGETPNYDNVKLNRITQLINALRQKPFADLRVLDLACQDGMYSLELGSQGASVLGVEIREPHLARAAFARDALKLDRVAFRRGDIRKLSADTDGQFDVVLMLGILYHLTPVDAAQLFESLFRMCTDMLVIDSHVSLEDAARFEWNGDVYTGRWAEEHASGSSNASKAERLWSSWDNDRAFLFTRPSLIALLRRVGFTIVMQVLAPLEPGKPDDRVTIVALKRSPVTLFTSPVGDSARIECVSLPAPPMYGARAHGRLRRWWRRLRRA
jgi:hypothetical protein